MPLPTSPSLAAARTELATLVKAAADAWTSYGYALPVEADNRDMVDLGSVEAQKPFLSWQLLFRGGGQASFGKDPLAVQYGQLVLATKTKEGTGLVESLTLLDHVIPYLEMKDLAVVRTEAAQVFDGVTRQGWYCVPAIINFWIHRIVAPA